MSQQTPKLTKNQIIFQFQQYLNKQNKRTQQLEEEIKLIHQRLNYLEENQEKADELVDFLNKPVNFDNKDDENEEDEQEEIVMKQEKPKKKEKQQKTTSLMFESKIEEKEEKKQEEMKDKKEDEKEQKEKKSKLKQKKEDKHINSQSFDNSQILKNKEKEDKQSFSKSLSDKEQKPNEKIQKEKKKDEKTDKEINKMKKGFKSLEHDGKQTKMQINDMKKHITDYDKTLKNVKGEMNQLIELHDQQTKKTETQVQRMLSVTMKNEDMKKGIKQQKFLSKRDKYYIKQWTNLDIENPVFDSYVDNWKQNTFDFGKSILGKEKLLFVIEDYNGNMFGVYLHKRLSINQLSIWVETCEQSFIFSLESKGRIDGPKKFMFKDPSKGYYLYTDYVRQLISFANGTILLWKESNHYKSKYKRQEDIIDYAGETGSLVGRAYENQDTFLAKRIVVFQMIPMFKSISVYNEIVTNKLQEFADESSLLGNATVDTMTGYYVNQIQELTTKQFKEVLFDSTICNWNRFTSTFDKRIFGKQQIALLIEDMNDNVFGVYVNASVNHYQYKEIGTSGGTNIQDPEAFIFSLKKDGNIVPSTKYLVDFKYHVNAFSLYDQDDIRLFGVGGSDIIITKNDFRNQCSTKPLSYEYNTVENPLRNKTNENDTSDNFTVKRVRVFQMEDRKENENATNIFEERWNKMFEEEQLKLKEITPSIQKEYSEEIKQIEQWTNTTFKEVAFSTEHCNWKQHLSTFDKHLLGREQVAIIIEDEENNQYGAFINIKIDNVFDKDVGLWFQRKVPTKKIFVFSLKSNGRLPKPTTFDKKKDGIIWAFGLMHKDLPVLFTIGCGFDIYVGKENHREESYCETKGVDFGGDLRVLNGKQNKNEYVPIRKVVVFQMYETDEQKQQRIIDEENERIEEQKQYENETMKLLEISSTIGNEYGNEIKQLEEWSELKYKEILFDSDICSWAQCDSTFDKRIFNKEKLAIFIQTAKDIKFGGFVYKQIDRYRGMDSKKNLSLGIRDHQSFTFTFRENKPMKFTLKSHYDESNPKSQFFLYRDSDWRLFVFGACDIWVPKKGWKAVCANIKETAYDYKDIEDALAGQSGWDVEKECYDIKRLMVLQFE